MRRLSERAKLASAGRANGAAILEYVLLASIMGALILTAAKYAGVNLSGAFEVVGASFEQPALILKASPARGPVRARPPVKPHPDPDLLSWIEDVQ